MKTLIAVIALLLLAATYTCQYDGLQLYFTGQTKVEWGKLVKLYKCPAGHEYWIVD